MSPKMLPEIRAVYNGFESSSLPKYKASSHVPTWNNLTEKLRTISLIYFSLSVPCLGTLTSPDRLNEDFDISIPNGDFGEPGRHQGLPRELELPVAIDRSSSANSRFEGWLTPSSSNDALAQKGLDLRYCWWHLSRNLACCISGPCARVTWV